MLTAATLGMVAYSVFSMVTAITDLLWQSRVEWWSDAGVIAFALLLLLSAAFVRVRIPGGLALAIGALLGLQALSVRWDAHSEFGLRVLPQALRGIFALWLVALAFFGAQKTGKTEDEGGAKAPPHER